MFRRLTPIVAQTFLVSIFLLSIAFVFPNIAMAGDYNTLTWDTFIPPDGEIIPSNSMDIVVTVTDWDSLADGSLKLFLDETQIPVSATYQDEMVYS